VLKKEFLLYAIIKAGGKQYKVREGDELLLEKIKGDQGDKIEVGRVIFVNNDDKIIHEPEVLSKIKVKGEILEHIRDEKIIVFKYKAKKGYKRKRGHRQNLTRVKIKKISLPKAVAAKYAVTEETDKDSKTRTPKQSSKPETESSK
jgi:large subunit ribosomal protein L21